MVTVFAVAVGLAPIPGPSPITVPQRDMQVAVTSWLTHRWSADVPWLMPPPAWHASDSAIAAAVEGVAGQRFRTHVRIIEQDLRDVDPVRERRWHIDDEATHDVGIERSWGVWSPDPHADGLAPSPRRVSTVGGYRTRDAAVLIDPAAAQARSAILAHELAHALADQHGGAQGGHRLATEGFAAMIEGRIVAGAGPWRWDEHLPDSDATYGELTGFWLPYVAAPLAFEQIARDDIDAIWSALRDPSGEAVLTPAAWQPRLADGPLPSDDRFRLLRPEGGADLLALNELDPGHWVVLLGQHHPTDKVRRLAAGVTSTVEVAFRSDDDRTCVTATMRTTTVAASRALSDGLADWAAAHESRAVAEGPERVLHIVGCDPEDDDLARLDPAATAAVADLIQALRDDLDRPVSSVTFRGGSQHETRPAGAAFAACPGSTAAVPQRALPR